jgi:hypothetical protein
MRPYFFHMYFVNSKNRAHSFKAKNMFEPKAPKCVVKMN